ncbi:MAG: formate C-acetyltransferase/glycerol dehydratase family glycyl radical enzyme [Candidatus Thorarchaeota archaeon]
MASTRIQRLRDHVVHSTPAVSIQRAQHYTSSMKQTESEPMIIRQAKALVSVLEKIPVVIFPGELIVGAIVEEIPGALIYPEGVGLRVVPELADLRTRDRNAFQINDEAIETLENEIDPYWIDCSLSAYAEKITPETIMDRLYEEAASSFILTEIAGIGHVSISYPLLLSIGFEEFIERSKEKIQAFEEGRVSDPEAITKALFYKATKIVARGIVRFAQRYADLAHSMAQEEKNEARKEELGTIAEICRWVPGKPPRTLQEAIQFVRFTQLALSLETYDGQAISMGRMDQYLYPYYEKDIQAGLLDREKAAELIANLWIKIAEHVPLFDNMVNLYFGGLLNTQAVTIGGMNENGKDATNDLTYIICEATKQAALPIPNVHIRIHKNSPSKLLMTIAQMVTAGTNNIGIFNDETIISSLIRKNIPLEEARNFATVGCVELAPFGTSFTSSDAALFNIALCFELALTNGESLIFDKQIGPKTGDPQTFQSIEEVIVAFRKQVAHFVQEMAIGSNCFETANIALKPTPFLSLCVQDCFEVGRDITTGSARYNFTGVQGVGMADVADSLAAMNLLVFQEKRVSMKELLDALKGNFQGNEELRQLLINHAPKYGDDDEKADRFAQLVAEIYSTEVEKHKNVRGGWFIPGMYSVTTHAPFGYNTGALPSGRLAGEPLSNGACPVAGAGKKGLTATLNSVAKIDYSRYPNGIAYTVTIDPSIVSGKKGSDILAALVRTYFELGGMQIQFNVIDEKILKEAKKCPEAHRNILVRVAGYSAYFADLAEDVQNEIIKRYQREIRTTRTE